MPDTRSPIHPQKNPGDERRARLLLALGAAAGLCVAAIGLLQGSGETQTLPEGAVARVNGALIRVEDYERLVSGVEQDTRAPANVDLRRHVLDRMIDEELLVQHGLELGLAQLDRRVRANLTSAIIDSVMAEISDRQPDAAELADFYAENRDFFSSPGRVRVRQIFLRARNAEEAERARARAEEAKRRIEAGEDFEAVRAELGDPEVSPLPDAPLPLTKLREYLGPTAMRSAAELDVGALSSPIRSGSGIHVLWLVARQETSVPALETIRPQVASEWRRRLGDETLREYLDQLREQADVQTDPELAGEN